MKKIIAFSYYASHWLVLLILFISFLLFFILESPSPFFKVLEEPLKAEGIKYGKIEGSLLSGFTLYDVNYKDEIKIKSLVLHVDIKRLQERVLFIDTLAVNGLEIEKSFLADLLDANQSNQEPNKTNVSLPFDTIVINDLKLSINNTAYLNYAVTHALLEVKNFKTDMKKEYKGQSYFFLDSNVSKMELEGKIADNKYEIDANIEGEQLFLMPILKEYNLAFLQNPKLVLKAKGDYTKVNFSVLMESLNFSYEPYIVKTKKLVLDGNYDVVKQDLKFNIDSKLDANVAKLNMNFHAFVNLKDINNSLSFKVKSKLKPKKKLVEDRLIKKELEAQKIEIYNFPEITLLAKGDMHHVDFNSTLHHLKMRHEKIDVNLKTFNFSGETEPLRGKTKVKFLSDFDTSPIKGHVDAHAKFNFREIEKSLDFKFNAKLEAYETYLNSLTKEHNVSIQGVSPVSLVASGSMQKLNLKMNAKTILLYENITSQVTIESDEIKVDLLKEQVDGTLHVDSKAKNLAFKFQSEFKGAYMNPKNLKSKSILNILTLDALDINLNEFVPINLEVVTNTGGLDLEINAKKLQLKVLSRDYNAFKFFVKSEAIYPYKIVKLPKNLEKKFVKLDLKGDLSLAEQYFTLLGVVESNKKFQVKIDIASLEEGLNAMISTKALSLELEGDLEKKEIEARVKVDSLKRLQKELSLLYPFTLVEVEGGIKLNAKMQGEVLSATLTSKKLAFQEFSIKDIRIDSLYEKELLTINKFNFRTSGFKKDKLNQKFYLNQKGLISLGTEKKLLLDMHPNILLKAEGKQEDLKAVMQIEALPLGYPNYGETTLSCDIDYLQEGKKKKITGGIFLDKLRVFYESNFLDPSEDNDIIIIKKNKKIKKLEESFLNDTFIDLGIYSKDAKYQTKEIKLRFNVNIKAQKSFGKNLKLLGKIEEINGWVEQAPKLFTVVDSNIVFQGRKEINPLLDLSVEYELPDILITIDIHGNAKRPKLIFSSEPPLPKKDILSYLLLGVSTAGLAEGKGSIGREAQLFIMNQAARDLAYEVGLDRVFVKDDGTGEGYAVQVGKKIGEDSMLIIENSTEGNSFILEYDVSENIKIEVGQHQKVVPSQSIDIFFRKRFK